MHSESGDLFDMDLICSWLRVICRKAWQGYDY